MKTAKCVLTTILAFLIASTIPTLRADEEDGVPSFKNNSKRETEDFARKVGAAVVKAARFRPVSIELSSHKCSSPRPRRHELEIEMTYKGYLTRKHYKADIVIKIDSSEKTRWEVLDIDYTDSNKTTFVGPNLKKIRALIPVFNK